MTVNISYLAGAAAQFFDNDGNIVAGGKLYTYLAGTSTPATTYTTSTGLISNANPVALNSAGRPVSAGGSLVEIWLTAGVSYKFVLTDANDVQIWTYDNIQGVTDNSIFVSNLANTSDPTKGDALVGFRQSNSAGNLPGSVGKTVHKKLQEFVSVLDFGAYNDGTHATENSVAIQSAIDYCQTTRQTLYFGPGIFAFDASLVLDSTASNEGIALVGDAFQSAQAGSARPSCTLRWTGGSGNMFNVNGSYFSMYGFAVENFGSADNFFFCTAGQWYRFGNMDFVNGNGTTNFVYSLFRAETNNFGYSIWEQIQCTSCADEFLYVNGNGGGNGLTPIEIRESEFESNSGGALTVVKLVDTQCDAININNCGFNQQTDDELCIINTTGCVVEPSITQVTFRDNEIDCVGTVSTNRMFRLANTINIDFSNNTIQGGGAMEYLGYLIKSNIVNLSGNYARSVGYLFEVTDAYSSINVGWNNLANASMLGTYNLNAAQSGIYTLDWNNPTIVLGQKFAANAHGLYRVNVTTNAAWVLSVNNDAYWVKGQVFTVQIRNTSGGAIATPTTVSAIVTAGALVAPANGYSRCYTFFFSGTQWIEISRSSADIPN